MEWAARPFCSLVESFPQGIYPLLEESPAFRGAQCRLMAAPLSGRKFDYIIINDGSTDHTEKLCRKKQYHYISLPVNLGLTGAMQTGMKYAKEKNYDMAV